MLGAVFGVVSLAWVMVGQAGVSKSIVLKINGLNPQKTTNCRHSIALFCPKVMLCLFVWLG